MASMQNFLGWIRAKSKKAQQRSNTNNRPSRAQLYSAVPDSAPESPSHSSYNPHLEGHFHESQLQRGSARGSVCRSSMKLPPLPASCGEITCQVLGGLNRRPRGPMMGVASLRNDSPAHIYEEIPNHLVDNSQTNNMEFTTGTDTVNVNNLDFAQAKDFGGFMVVPIRGKAGARRPSDETNNNNDQDNGFTQQQKQPDASICDNNSTNNLDFNQCNISTNTHHVPGNSASSAFKVVAPNQFESTADPTQATPGLRLLPNSHQQFVGHPEYQLGHAHQHQELPHTTILPQHHLQANSGTVSENYPHRHHQQDQTHPPPSSDFLQVSQNSHNHHSHDHRLPDFSHCTHCSRPHGIFNGVSMGHFGNEELDPESLELQTYFNKQMLQQPEGPDGSVVERFLIVPSRPELTEDLPPNAPAEDSSDHQGQEIADFPAINLNFQSEEDHNVNNIIKDQVDDLPKDSEKGQVMSDGNDTCNEYDLRSSDRSSSTSQSRPGSYAFDSGSSLYAFSNGENKDGGILNSSSASSGIGMASRHRPHESDSSNDTFSEYDMQPSPEYEYYLSKAQHNLWFKKDVMRVIRESSSEYETTSDVGSVKQCSCTRGLDNISLTTVTSLSDLSLSDDKESNEQRHKHKCNRTDRSNESHKGEVNQTKCQQCECQQSRSISSRRQRTRTKTKHSGRTRTERRHSAAAAIAIKESGSSSEALSEHSVPAWERQDRRSRSSFTSSSCSSSSKYNSRRKASSNSKRSGAELYQLPDFSQSSPSVCSANLIEEPERLSCRATDFTPQNTKLTPVQNSVQQLPLGTHTGVGSRDPVNRLQHRRAPQQNRMLTDLMKMNHDRLLVLF